MRVVTATSNGKNTVIAGQSYVADIIADTGFTMDGATITITMGGIDMSNYYSNGKIAILSFVERSGKSFLV